MEASAKEIISTVGPEQGRRYHAVGKVGTSMLADTALVKEQAWSQNDVAQVRAFLLEAAKVADPTLFENFWEHMLLSSIYARRLAEQLNLSDLDHFEAEGIMLLHDLGRLVASSGYFRNDRLAEALFRRIGVRPDVAEKLPPIDKILGIGGGPITSIDQLTPSQRVTQVADNLGRKKNGKMMTLEDLQSTSLSNRYQGTWPSEVRALRQLTEPGEGAQTIKKQADNLINDEIAWMKDEVDFDTLRSHVLKESQEPQHQQWIRQAITNHQQAAHEASADEQMT